MEYIYDIFHNDNNKLIIIMPAEIDPPDIEYINDKMNLKFNLHICPHKHTFIYELLSETQYVENIKLLINNKIFIYVKVNKYPEFKNEIIMSTIVLNEDNYIRQWIEFHLNIGISRFIIYDNSKRTEKSNLNQVLSDFIEKEIVLLIKWTYPYRLKKSGFSGQTTQQNHSIYAFRNSKYIGLFDIDEYINMQNNTNINNFFDSMITNLEIDTNQIGSFKILNKFFVNPNNLSTNDYDFLLRFNCREITKKGNEKNFVIPKNVETFSVHMITRGKQMYSIESEYIYFNHYIFLNKLKRGMDISDLQDNTILKHCDFIKSPNFDNVRSDLKQGESLETFTNDTKIYFYIRGHIRKSFETDKLKNFVKLLKWNFTDIKFILQTWKTQECKSGESWRHITENNNTISKQIIEKYFEDEDITKHCLIIDDESIKLVGSTNGRISRSKAPLKGWKNMWYGIYKGLEHGGINCSSDIIISVRFDYFMMPQVNKFHRELNQGKIIQFIKDNLSNKNINFLNKGLGCDNFYMGRYNDIKDITEKFHFKLDDILKTSKKIINQEYLVKRIAELYNKYTFIHPTRTGGTACLLFFREYFKDSIKDNVRENNNPIIIIRDPIDRFLSMYFYWKYGTIDNNKRDKKFKEDNRHVNIKKFISFIKDNNIKKLQHAYTWDQHFFPQVKWIDKVDLKNLIVIKYQKDLDKSMQKLLSYLGFDNRDLILPKKNISNKDGENVILDDLDLQFIHEYYIKDFILIDKINLYPEMFKKIIF